ncbi:hypothetical protein MTsN2n4_39430 [Pseudoalteromonas sp. MTN2-4]
MIKFSRLLTIACVIFACRSLISDALSLNSDRLYEYFLSLAISVAILIIIDVRNRKNSGSN